MPPYRSPEQGSRYTSKFIRVEGRIFTTTPGDILTLHEQFARADGILEKVNRLRVQNPIQVDGGTYTVFGNRLVLDEESHGLKIPAIPGARDISVTVFQEQSPGFTVTKFTETVTRMKYQVIDCRTYLPI